MKQTVVTEQGNSYEQDITGTSIDDILERILQQTRQHLDDLDALHSPNAASAEGNIYEDEEEQLEQLIDAILDGDITEDNFDDYLQLWEPELLSDETGSHKTVSLTVYDDGSRSFKCFAPGIYFEVYEC